MNDVAHPNPPSGSRLKGQTLRLVSSLLVGLLVMLIGGLFGMALTKTVVIALAVAVIFWLGWLLIVRVWIRLARRRS